MMIKHLCSVWTIHKYCHVSSHILDQVVYSLMVLRKAMPKLEDKHGYVSHLQEATVDSG